VFGSVRLFGSLDDSPPDEIFKGQLRFEFREGLAARFQAI
jgi:hypothetical protein